MRRSILRVLGFLQRWALGFFGSLYAFTLGLYHKRHRALLLQAAAHFGYAYKPVASRPLPRISLAELFPQGFPVPLRFHMDKAGLEPGLVMPSLDNGGVAPLDLAVLAGMSSTRKPERIFEIGTFKGLTTYNLALNSPAAKVYTLDLPQAQMDSTALAVEAVERQFINKAVSGEHFLGTAVASRITQLFGDSATFDFSPYEGSMDLVFVDGSHAYGYVLNDARIALRLAKKSGSVILFHDYGLWDGVTKALEELAGEKEFSSMQHVEGTPVVLLERR